MHLYCSITFRIQSSENPVLFCSHSKIKIHAKKLPLTVEKVTMCRQRKTTTISVQNTTTKDNMSEQQKMSDSSRKPQSSTKESLKSVTEGESGSAGSSTMFEKLVTKMGKLTTKEKVKGILEAFYSVR